MKNLKGILLGAFLLVGFSSFASDTTAVNPIQEVLTDLAVGLANGNIDSTLYKELIGNISGIDESLGNIKTTSEEVFQPIDTTQDFWNLFNFLWGSIEALLVAGAATSFGAQILKLKLFLDKRKSIVTVILLAITFGISAVFLKGELNLLYVLAGSSSVGVIATVLYKLILKQFFGNGNDNAPIGA